MHPRLQELFDHLDAQRSALRAAVDDVPVALREQRPAPDQWSVAEVVGHLAIVEGRIAQLLAQAVTTARENGLGPERETSSALDTSLVSRMIDRSWQVKSPPTGEPAQGLTIDDAWAALEAARAQLLDVMRDGDGLALGEIVRPHPLIGPLDFYQWISWICSHEARHAAQIQETKETLLAAYAKPS